MHVRETCFMRVGDPQFRNWSPDRDMIIEHVFCRCAARFDYRNDGLGRIMQDTAGRELRVQRIQVPRNEENTVSARKGKYRIPPASWILEISRNVGAPPSCISGGNLIVFLSPASKVRPTRHNWPLFRQPRQATFLPLPRHGVGRSRSSATPRGGGFF